MPMLWD